MGLRVKWCLPHAALLLAKAKLLMLFSKVYRRMPRNPGSIAFTDTGQIIVVSIFVMYNVLNADEAEM